MSGDALLYGNPDVPVTIIEQLDNGESLVEFCDGSRAAMLDADLIGKYSA